jgi:hypothetical protein
MKRLFKALHTLYDSTGFVVWITGMLLAGMIALQQYLFANAGAAAPLLPLETLAWGLTVIAGGYVGTDRIASFVKTQTMEYGAADFGDVAKLRRMLWLLLALVGQALVVQTFFGVTNAPLNTLLLAYIGTGSAYAIGNKAVKIAMHSEGTYKAEDSQPLSGPTIKRGE